VASIVTARSAAVTTPTVTVVVTVALLLVALGSGSVPVTVTVLVRVVEALGVTVTLRVTVVEAAGARVPTAQVTRPATALTAQPGLEAGERLKVVPTGRGAVSVTPVAAEGPLLVTVTV
jgi:hypothetical protein